ncbi:TPA: hypothetical protein ACX8VE_001480 [Campylobacter jejuni]|nr:hypothetical protein [Campylobacter jejuni]
MRIILLLAFICSYIFADSASNAIAKMNDKINEFNQIHTKENLVNIKINALDIEQLIELKRQNYLNLQNNNLLLIFYKIDSMKVFKKY